MRIAWTLDLWIEEVRRNQYSGLLAAVLFNSDLFGEERNPICRSCDSITVRGHFDLESDRFQTIPSSPEHEVNLLWILAIRKDLNLVRFRRHSEFEAA